MPLFQNTVLAKYFSTQNQTTIAQKWQAYKTHFLNPTIQENIKNSKEEQYQEGFLRDLFVNILGYTLNPAHDFNLTTELKNVKDSKKADGGIIIQDKVVGVIELKGTNTTDLAKVESQAFGYKNNQPACVYVITANFEKLRFYIDNAIEHIEFNLFTLAEQDFKLLYLCLAFENIKTHLPKKLKEESLSQEELITKQLYKDYSLFKRELFQNLTAQNPQFDPLELFKKSQKLLDRFLFLFFAEDRNLLPPNSVRLILQQWKKLQDLDAYTPLYDRFKKYFGYLNTGFKGKQYDVFAYNGGLFEPDPILANITIDDALLYKHTLTLSEYDFESEVDVNILGHIFENSLNELDEVKAQLAGQAVDKSNTKRKKDGVFYTPKYITKYIVENTVGKLCAEKKAALEIVEEHYSTDKKKQKKTIKALAEKLKTYRDWLLQLTICDPACGSGAFLNEALNFLIAEHSYVDELQAKLFGDALILSDVENSILENNLFGVDLNEESVEIAKLSLWLRTAQPNRKLNSLNNNIKCGNSLIDDPAIAGDKAFHWQKEFPTIFKEKNKKAYHITTAIHDSRTSKRMRTYKVRERRDMGTNPYPNVIYFTPEDDLLITQTIAEIVKEDHLNLLAYNICADHIHLLLVCDIEEVPTIMQKIKGRTSYHLGKYKGLYKGLKPLDEQSHGEQSHDKKPLWQQKYSPPKEVTSQEQLQNTLRYIQKNRSKHELPPHAKELQAIIEAMCCTEEQAFAPAYEGGFDVVIGNPPYFNVQTLGFGSKEAKFIQENYPKIWQDKSDILFYFFYKSMQISKNAIGFIVSNAFLFSDKAQKLRNYILEDNRLSKIINFEKFMIFNDASITSCVTIFNKNTEITKAIVLREKKYSISEISKEINNKELEYEIKLEKNKVFALVKKKIADLNKKIDSNHKKLKDVYHLGKGMETAANSVFTFDAYPSQFPGEFIKKRMVGENIDRYSLNFSNTYILYFEDVENFEELPKVIQNHLILNKEILERRATVKNEGRLWWRYSRPMHKEYYDLNKIWCSYRSKQNEFILDETSNFIGLTNTTVMFDTNNNYSIKFILSLLNSRLLNFRYKSIGKQTGSGVFEYFANGIGKFPIPKISLPNQKPFIEKADQMLSLNKALQETASKFQRTLQRKFETLEKLPKKLEQWYELSFAAFVKELKKKKITLPLAQEAEWEDYFLAAQEQALTLKAQIDATDAQIDTMVYELYGLTEEEIQIVENT